MAVHVVIGVRFVLHITFLAVASCHLPVSIAFKLIVQIFNSLRSVVELVVKMVHNVTICIFFGFVTKVCRPRPIGTCIYTFKHTKYYSKSYRNILLI